MQLQGYKTALAALIILFVNSLSLFSSDNVDAALVSEQSSISPGMEFWTGLHLEMKKDWHTYYKEPGDSGLATKIIWDLPKGFTASEIEWPKPYTFEEFGLVSYGYKDEVLLAVKITAPGDLKVGDEFTLKGEAKWLECAEICIPGSANLSLTLTVADTPTYNSKWKNKFDETRLKWENAPSSDSTNSEVNESPSISLPYFLLMGFFGGLILNLMPCVFPVIGLKIMSFVKQADEEASNVFKHGIIYTLGVLVSFWILAAAFISLKSAGEAVGWGFQMQNPDIVIAVTFIMLLFAMNMSGVFEIGMSATGVGNKLSSKSGNLGTFFTGILATIVSTPCSAPILGTALSATIQMSPSEITAIFSSIGLGLASPYLILSLFPKLMNFLPKPGAWMESFKQFLSFALYATVGYLVWVLAGQISEERLLNTIIALVLTSMAAWIYGRWCIPGKSSKTKKIALLLIVGLLGISYYQAYKSDSDVWQTWSPETVKKLRAENKTIYIDFTARWCLTCQANKKTLFASDEFVNYIKDNSVVMLKADWTNQDERITHALKGYGRSAVPTNVIYLPGKDDPILLPELLTPGIVLDALKGN